MTQEQKAILYDWQHEYRTEGEAMDALIQTLDERHSTLVDLLLDPKTSEDATSSDYISDNTACEMIEQLLKDET